MTTLRFQSNIGNNYSNRVILANILGDGQTHSMSELETRLGTSPRGVRARISDLRTQSGLVIENYNGFVRLTGVRIQ